MKTTLAGRVVRLTTVSATVIILIFGFAGYRIIKGNAKTEIIHRQQVAAAAAMSTVERMLADALDHIQIIADDGTSGQRLELGQAGPDSSRVRAQQEQFDESVRLSGPWDRVVVVDKAGTIVVTDGGRHIDQSMLDDAVARGVFAAALAGRITHSDVYLPEGAQRPALVFAAPIRSDAGDRSEILGVALGWFALPALNHFLDEVRPPSVPRLVNAQA